jgi:hypothetical protein
MEKSSRDIAAGEIYLAIPPQATRPQVEQMRATSGCHARVDFFRRILMQPEIPIGKKKESRDN